MTNKNTKNPTDTEKAIASYKTKKAQKSPVRWENKFKKSVSQIHGRVPIMIEKNAMYIGNDPDPKMLIRLVKGDQKISFDAPSAWLICGIIKLAAGEDCPDELRMESL